MEHPEYTQKWRENLQNFLEYAIDYDKIYLEVLICAKFVNQKEKIIAF